MASAEVMEQDYVPTKKKPLSDDDMRRKKMVPGGLMKAMMRPGGSESTPKDGDQFIIAPSGQWMESSSSPASQSLEGRVYQSDRSWEKSKILLGLLEGMPTMLKGEVAMFKIKSRLHYGEEDCPVSAPNNFPKDDELHFEIEMIDFFKPKDNLVRRRNVERKGLADCCIDGNPPDDMGVVKKVILEFSSGEGLFIMDEAEKIRSTGNRLFKEEKFELAKVKYEKVLREFNHVNPQDDEEGKEFLNARVLDVIPAHVKVLYRRGMAYMTARDFQEARNDFESMMQYDKSSEPDAPAALLKLKHKQQEVERKAQKQFKGLFDKKTGEISEAGSELNNEHSDTVADKEVMVQNGDPTNDTDSLPEDRDETPRSSWVFQLWPTGRRLFTALGVDRCSIL